MYVCCVCFSLGRVKVSKLVTLGGFRTSRGPSL